MKRKLLLLCAATALVLEALPRGAVCSFANPEGEPYRYTYSYFDLTPFAYANFAPLAVAALTCALLALALVSVFMKRPFRRPIAAVSALAALLSFAPLLLGFEYFTPVGSLISVSLTGAAVIARLK